MIKNKSKSNGNKRQTVDNTVKPEIRELLPRETDGLYQAVFTEARDGIALIDFKTGAIKDCNKEFERQTGRKLPQLRKMNIWDIRPLEQIESAKSKFLEVKKKGEGSSAELDFQKPDGKIVPVEFKSRVIIFRGKRYILSISRDITERREAEKALLESENKLRLMLDSVTDGIAVTDLEGTITEINKRAVEMYGAGDRTGLIGKSAFEFIAPHDREIAMINLQRTLEKGMSEGLEYSLIRADVSEYPGEINASVLKDTSGAPVGFIAIIRDITERKKAEEALRYKEEYFRALIENSLDAITILNADGSIRYESPSYERVLGYKPEERIGTSLLEHIHPDDVSTVIETFAQFIQDRGGILHTEVRARHKDGTWRNIEAIGRNLLDDPVVQGIVVNMRDVTDRKQAEDALRESEEKYREVVERAHEGIAIVQDGLVKFANPRVLYILGYTPGEIINTPMTDHIHPDELPRVLNNYQQRMKGEQVESLYETALLYKDGHRVDVELSAGVIMYEGEPSDMVMVRDITERKKAEEALRESEKRYRLLAENATDVIWTMDLNLRSTYISPSVEYLRGYTAEEAMAFGIERTLTPASLEVARKVFQEELANEEETRIYPFGSRNIEMEMYCKDGSTVWTEVSVRFLRDPDGNPVGILGVTRNITERKRMEQQLLLTGRLAAVGQLAAGVAHELNNPLAAVQAFAQLLNERDDLDAIAQSDVDTIYREAQRASRITGNLLSFARQHKPEKNLISINELLEESLELQSYRLNINNVNVTTVLDPDLPGTMADSHQMQQVFVNLVTNAEQAMTEVNGGGKLLIKTMSTDGTIGIAFSDDGPGIPEENLKKIFDPFFTTKDVGKGTGLGLSICYGIVQEHGGNIYARNNSGKGVTFVVELPVTAENRTSSEPIYNARYLKSTPHIN